MHYMVQNRAMPEPEMTMKAKLGISPICWWNDDLVELSDDVSLD